MTRRRDPDKPLAEFDEYALELRREVEPAAASGEEPWQFVDLVRIAVIESDGGPCVEVVLRSRGRPGRLYRAVLRPASGKFEVAPVTAASIAVVNLEEDLHALANGSRDEDIDFEVLTDPDPPPRPGPPPLRVSEAIFEGGPLHSNRFPITPGKTDLIPALPKRLNNLTPEQRAGLQRPYTYSGEVLAAEGDTPALAVFIPLG